MTPIKIFLDASVILAGLGSIKASSYALLTLGKQKKLLLIVSPIVVDEAKRHVDKIQKSPQDIDDLIIWANIKITDIPTKNQIVEFSTVVIDPNDWHLLAACSQIKNITLVTLDRKHLISKRDKIDYPPILSPAEFLGDFLNMSLSI
jgi:predicted nucleic acid-binding protein